MVDERFLISRILWEKDLRLAPDLPEILHVAKVFQERISKNEPTLPRDIVTGPALLNAAVRKDQRVASILTASGAARDLLMRASGIGPGAVSHGRSEDANISPTLNEGVSKYRGKFPDRTAVDGLALAWICLESEKSGCREVLRQINLDPDAAVEVIAPFLAHKDHQPQSMPWVSGFTESRSSTSSSGSVSQQAGDIPESRSTETVEDSVDRLDSGNNGTVRFNTTLGSVVVGPTEFGAAVGALSDHADGEDLLGLSPYIQALADLAESKYVRPPLAVGIFGPWGSGKTYILNGIQRELGMRNHHRRWTWSNRVPVLRHLLKKVDAGRSGGVFFNAWKYASAERVWPALLSEVVQGTEKSVYSWLGREWRRGWRGIRRAWNRQATLQTVALVSAYFFLAEALGGGIDETLGTILKVALVAVGSISLHLAFKLGDAAALIMRDPCLDFINHDFAEIQAILATLNRGLETAGTRMVVLIDDLDRCEPAKVVEVIKAVHLLVCSGRFVVFIAVDPNSLSKSIEAAYDLENDRGLNYLEKIIQVPFRIPVPSSEQVSTFIASQMSPGDSGSHVPKQNSVETADSCVTVRHQAQLPTDEGAPQQPVNRPQSSRRRAVFTANEEVPFSKLDLWVFRALSRYARPNPRQIKRLVNTYVLCRYLAFRLDDHTVLSNMARFGAWLVIDHQWPELSHEIAKTCSLVQTKSREERDALMDAPYQEIEKVLETTSLGSILKRKYSDFENLKSLLRDDRFTLEWELVEAFDRYTACLASESRRHVKTASDQE